MQETNNETLVYGHSDDVVYVTGIHESFTLPLHDPLILNIDGVVLSIDYGANGNAEWTINVVDDNDVDVTVYDTDKRVDETNNYSQVAHIPTTPTNVSVVE